MQREGRQAPSVRTQKEALVRNRKRFCHDTKYACLKNLLVSQGNCCYNSEWFGHQRKASRQKQKAEPNQICPYRAQTALSTLIKPALVNRGRTRNEAGNKQVDCRGWMASRGVSNQQGVNDSRLGNGTASLKNLKRARSRLFVKVQVYDPSTQEAEAGGL